LKIGFKFDIIAKGILIIFFGNLFFEIARVGVVFRKFL